MKKDALDRYLVQIKLRNTSAKAQRKIQSIFDLMVEELQEKKESRLFTLASYQLLGLFKISYDPNHFRWSSIGQNKKLPLDHCWVILHVVKAKLCNEDFDEYVKILTVNNCTKLDFGKVKENDGQEYSNIERIKEITNCLKSIDQNLESSQFNKEENRTSKMIFDIEQQKREQYIQTFQQARQMVEEISGSFDKTQEELQKLNHLFYSFGQSSIFSELTTLYDLINEIELSQTKSLENGEIIDLKTNIENLQVFRSAALNIFAAAGVEAIISKPGTLVNGKIHEIFGRSNFDPRSTSIEKSLRAGFKIGETVLRKERVLIR